MAADPKPVKRHKADADEWEILRKLKLGSCRVCLSVSGVTLHHLVGRDLGGDDVPDNLVPLCVLCHQRVEERKRSAIESLRESLTAEEVAYIWAKKGYFYLVRYYPRHSAEDAQTTERAEESSAA